MNIISKVVGCGAYLPEKVVTNKDLAKKIDTSDEWIVARTGIRQRHMAQDGEMTSDLAYHAAKRAVNSAGIDPKDIDLVVVGTTTPDDTFPAAAVRVQSRLGLAGGAAFDVQAACSGFIYALSVADSMIRTGQIKTAIVIGADTLSKLLNWEDRTTCVLFGDGAGALVLQAQNVNGDATPTGVLSTHLHSDGNLRDILYCESDLVSGVDSRVIKMEGKEVFKHAVTNLASVVVEALEANGLQDTDIDWLVPHQANKRIIDSTAKKLKMTDDKVVLTIANHANTSAASIPLALDTAIKDGRIQPGNLLLMEAMGGGLTWGAALVRW
ncbi:MAG: 3-oxoacyl-ACP synthase [Rhodospirillaceae bacterium TMED167]|nr:3-oxoacyl-ACP synthase [Rhodospirillaceae bacterium]OUW25167.1 MAG: 3-oxoacyl-ACP synthase [Rhodospirillaceae bacterium TMED167]